MAQKTTAKKTVAEDPHYTQALQSYESGLRAMQEHKYEKAKPHFQKVISGPVKELNDRATVHLNICNQHLERATISQFKTPEEHFDYAVSLMNVGDYVTAREHLEKLQKQNAKADYVIYGLAALELGGLGGRAGDRAEQRRARERHEQIFDERLLERAEIGRAHV